MIQGEAKASSNLELDQVCFGFALSILATFIILECILFRRIGLKALESSAL